MKISLNIEVIAKKGTLILTDTKGKAVTFSKNQVIQKKVSMITLGELTNLPKLEVAEGFGYATRKSYYDIRNTVLNGQPTDLIPRQTGPKTAPKRTREVEILVIRMRFETDYNMYEIADKLQRLGFDISARLVGKILSDYGLAKKNLSNFGLQPRLLAREEIEILERMVLWSTDKRAT